MRNGDTSESVESGASAPSVHGSGGMSLRVGKVLGSSDIVLKP